MIIAHLGLAFFVLGVTVSTSFGQQMTARMTPGEPLLFADFHLRLDGQENVAGANYSALRASVSAQIGEHRPVMLYPERRTYGAKTSVLTEAAISSDWRGDLFLALGDNSGDGAWTVTLRYKPLVRFIWVGVLAMLFGGLLSILSRDQNIKRVKPVIRTPHKRRSPGQAAFVFVAIAFIASGLFAMTGNDTGSIDTVSSFESSAARTAARAHLDEYRFSAARQAYAEVLALDPHDNVAKLGWVQASLAINHKALLGEAGGIIEEVLADLPDDSVALWYGAKAAQSKGDFRLAYSRWNHLLELTPPPLLRQAITEQLASIERRWQDK